MTGELRPDRHSLLELAALLDQIAAMRDEGDAARFYADEVLVMRFTWARTGPLLETVRSLLASTP